MVIDYNTVKYVTQRAEETIKDLHLRMEAPGLDEASTNILRGRILDARASIEDVLQAYKSTDRMQSL